MNQFKIKFKAVLFDFEGTIVHGNTVHDDARELIIKLKKSGAKLGIASNTSTNSIRLRLEKNNLLQYFDTIVGIDQVDFIGKPNPDIFLKTAENLECKPKDCIVIEDSESGAEGAVQAGMSVVLVRGAKHKQALYVGKTLDDAELYTILSV